VYEYDGDGTRVRSGHDSGQGNVWDTRFYYDTAAPLYSYVFESDDAKNMTVAYTIDPYGDLVSQRRNSATYYHLYDRLTSTRQLLDSNQATTDTYSYYAFGEVRTSSGSTTNPFKFVGRLGYYDDPTTDFQYLRARYYAPAYGRLLRRDPLGEDSRDYLYHSPLAGVDPSGMVSVDPRTCGARTKWIKQHLGHACDKAYCIGSGLRADYTKSCQNARVYCEKFWGWRCTRNICAYVPPYSTPGNCVIMLCDQAGKPQCGTYGCTLLHELVHCAGGGEPEAYACEYECCAAHPPVPKQYSCPKPKCDKTPPKPSPPYEPPGPPVII